MVREVAILRYCTSMYSTCLILNFIIFYLSGSIRIDQRKPSAAFNARKDSEKSCYIREVLIITYHPCPLKNLSYDFSLWICDSRLHHMRPLDFDTSSYLNINLVSYSQRHSLSITLSITFTIYCTVYFLRDLSAHAGASQAQYGDT